MSSGSATVDLYLPATVRPPREQPRPLCPIERAGDPLDLLVVDDDPLVLANTAAMLEDLGHSVRLAASGEDALDQLARGGCIDLVLTDQLMPRMTGSELARRIRATAPDMPVLIVSGYAELETGEASRFPMLSKPFNQAALARAVADVRGSANVVPLRRAG